MSDLLVRAIDAHAGLRIIAAITTDLSREAARRHGALGLGACALGRGLTSGLLLATLTKGAERVTLQLVGSGPLGGLTIDASLDPRITGMDATAPTDSGPKDTGKVRGLLLHPQAATTPCLGRGRVVEILGRDGLVNVTRDLGLTQRYQGQVALHTGEVDEDVEQYLRGSEQVPSALGCDVVFADGLSIDGAAGVLVQALPGASDDAVWEAQRAVRSGAVYQYLVGGGRDAHALARAVYRKPLQFLGEQPLLFECRCSGERVHEMMKLLGVVELDEILADRGLAEVTCNYCNTHFVVERAELETIREELAGGPRVRN